MKKLLVKNLHLRTKYFYNERKMLLLKSLSVNEFISAELRLNAKSELRRIGSKSNSSSISNRCFITNRGRAIFPRFGFSRIMVRQLALNGKLPGVMKQSW